MYRSMWAISPVMILTSGSVCPSCSLLARVYRILRHQVKLEDQLDKVLARPTVEAFKSNISAATRPAGPAPNVTTSNVDAPSAPPMEVPVLAKKAK
jgi:hypothetical protein